MERTIIALYLALSFAGQLEAGDYHCQKIAYVSIPEGMVIAPGRNDGINRIYVAGTKPTEITWNGSGWDTLSIGETTSARSIAAGFGRNDSICRIYIGDGMGARLWEYSYDDGIWERTMMDDRIGTSLWAVALGDVKNDDTIRVVAGGDDSTAIAYTYQSSLGTWRKDSLPSVRGFIGGIDIGPGRNDDTNRVYSSSPGRWWVEYSYRNQWDTICVLEGGGDILLCKARNDSIVRLYTNAFSCFEEYYWSANQWEVITIIGDTTPSPSDLNCGFARDDSLLRLYVATSKNRLINDTFANVYVYEYEYTALWGWLRKELPAVIWNPGGRPRFTMLSVVVGDARNDGLNRIYGSCGNHEIFEWEWDDTLSVVAGEPRDERPKANIADIAAMPNPFISEAAISFHLPQSGHVSLDIYDITGRLVSCNSLGKKQAGAHSFAWGGKNSQGSSLPPGVYFVSLCVDGRQVATVKMVNLK